MIGHGAGAADRLTSALPEHDGAGHPHNDYLRILVDYGIVGLVLWLIAYFALLRLTWRRWGAMRGTRTIAEHIHGAAVLVLIGIGLTMIVDNPLIELARMAPAGGPGRHLARACRRPGRRRPRSGSRPWSRRPCGAGSSPAA